MDFENDALGWLLDPVDPETFHEEYRGREHLIAGEPDRARFEELLSFEDLDRVLGTYGLRVPDIRVTQSGKDIEVSDYVWKDSVIDPMRAARLFAEGATLIFGQLQDRLEPLRALCTGISRESSRRTQTNIYLTPPHSQGFDPHWDTHDVFVIQVEGSKHWRTYEGGLKNPVRDQKFDPEQHEAGEVTDDFVLEAGQVLYIPRGLMHAADTTDEVSLHVTLGVMAYTWADLLAELVAELTSRSTKWREGLPWDFSKVRGQEHHKVRKLLEARLEQLPEHIDLEAVLEEYLHSVDTAHRPRMPDYMQQALRASTLSEGDRIARRPGPPSRVERRGERVVVVSGEREVGFPAAAERTLTSVMSASSIPFSDIDDELDAPSRKTVISTLIREGILATQANGENTEATNGK